MNTIVQNDQKNLEKRPVKPTLDSMQLNDVEVFPVIQLESVRQAKQKVQTFKRGRYFATKIENDTIKVTRTA